MMNNLLPSWGYLNLINAEQDTALSTGKSCVGSRGGGQLVEARVVPAVQPVRGRQVMLEVAHLAKNYLVQD